MTGKGVWLRRLRYALAVLWFLRAGSAFGAGADATTLFGIDGFHIEIGTVSKAARILGFEESRLRLLASERLQRASLAVGDFPAILVISLRTIEHPTTVVAYCLEVQVRQVMQLARTEQIQMLAPTWTTGTLTMVTQTSFIRSVEDALAALLDQLVQDYRSVNETQK
jgi:hypothetical protein